MFIRPLKNHEKSAVVFLGKQCEHKNCVSPIAYAIDEEHRTGANPLVRYYCSEHALAQSELSQIPMPD
jgi:hypothetical protein